MKNIKLLFLPFLTISSTLNAGSGTSSGLGTVSIDKAITLTNEQNLNFGTISRNHQSATLNISAYDGNTFCNNTDWQISNSTRGQIKISGQEANSFIHLEINEQSNCGSVIGTASINSFYPTPTSGNTFQTDKNGELTLYLGGQINFENADENHYSYNQIYGNFCKIYNVTIITE